ncbi:HET domain-containing protein [Teratosphaeria destructans]|uniref:HET domain-containing protein n=1 Tax=Teratosphaeria destructans TaxID=418781 RepID=A0A9W7W683_9PEZI|nr:HET domain-containing protein [Teratosphaeria destructans]
MWLLNVHTYELREFIMNGSGTDRPLYTILSHTWEGEEVLFKDMFDLEGARQKLGWRKIEYMCRQTITDGYDWTWIDTCCIDKSSSAELSEAINSMFLWYQGAEICHVYLSDARNDGVPGALVTDATRRHAAFRRCRWWARGW